MLGKRLINSNSAAAGGSCTTDTLQILGDTSCIAYYKMSDATDESGNFDGTPTSVNFNVAGKFGNAGSFNGSSSSIDTNYTVPADSTMSFSVWFNTNSTARQAIFADYNSAGAGISTRAALMMGSGASNDKFEIVIGNGSSFWNDLTTDCSLYQDGAWHNIVVIYNGTSVKLYADGNSIADLTSSVAYGAAGTQSLVLGKGGDYSGIYFNGSIDQVRIFNKALSSSEVTTLYNEVYCLPTIVPTDYFNPVIYTGNGSTQSITGVGFEPDLAWLKSRTDAYNAQIFDSVRTVGANKELTPSQTYAEGGGNSAAYGFVGSLNTDGFTLSAGSINSSQNNGSGQNYVSWNWKAGGAVVSGTGTGAISSVSVSANQDAGFSVVKYSNSGASGTYTHGLNSAPEVVIRKRTDSTSGWVFATTVIDGSYDYLLLNTTAAKTNYATTAPTSTVVTEGDIGTYISYNFHSVDGYSKIGSYFGNASSDGPYIFCGFRPAWIMIKHVSGTAYSNSDRWLIYDTKRQPTNPSGDNASNVLYADSSGAENSIKRYTTKIFSNGFQLAQFSEGANNTSSDKYIYMAFAEEVFNPNGVTRNATNPFGDASEVALYKFESDGTDSEGNYTTTTLPNVTFASGYIGNAAVFNGSSSGINLPSSLNTSVIDATGAFSISMWINANDISTIQYLFAANVASNIDLGINVTGVAGKIVWTIYNGSYSYLVSTTTITTNTWYHIVATYNNSLRELFINGVSQGTATKTLVESSIEPTLGYRNTGGSVHFNGEIDQVRIFDRALDSGEVTQLYNE